MSKPIVVDPLIEAIAIMLHQITMGSKLRGIRHLDRPDQRDYHAKAEAFLEAAKARGIDITRTTES